MHYSVITRAELVAGTTATDLTVQLLARFCEIPLDRSVAERGDASPVSSESGFLTH